MSEYDYAIAANADPNRLVPLDAARRLEREGAIGRLHGEFMVTVGNGTPVATARRFGVEWAAELRKAGVRSSTRCHAMPNARGSLTPEIRSWVWST